MKKIISAVLVCVLAVFTAVPVFAVEGEELINLKTDFLNYVTECESYYIYGDYNQPSVYPCWSKASRERLQTAITTARGAQINTFEELEKANTDFDSVISKMTVDKREVEFMVYLCEKENNDNEYYNESTWSFFQDTLAEGKAALESDDEEVMYCAYINMRNAFNDICKYNTVYGDFNGDGELNISDITYGQKEIANSVEFNSSQRTISMFNAWNYLSISHLTDIQKYMVGSSEKMQISALDNLLSLQEFDLSTRYFALSTETANRIYSSEWKNYFSCRPQ